jgi:polysaccharide biosynthesis protein PslH
VTVSPGSRTTRRRILVLTPFPPRLDAAHGGGRAVSQAIARFALRHDVAVLALRREGEPAADERLHERVQLLEEVNRPLVRNSPRRLWAERQRLTLLASRAPDWVVGCSVAAYARRLRALLQDWRPDVVQIEFAVMGQYARLVEQRGTPRVLVEYDPGDSREDRSWMRYRASVMRRVDAVVAFTRRDEELLRPLVREARLARIPLGADLPPSALDPRGTLPPSLLFVGNFAHPPNVEAARRLARTIAPRVQERFGDVVLYLVGDSPPTYLARPGVVVTGRVDEVTPYLDRAAVVVTPLDSGGGMRVKVLESLAAGKAVVASPLAVEGLDVVDGEQILIADSDDAFTAAVESLLVDEERRVALAGRARAWSLANLDWESSIRAYESLYDSLLGAPTRAP